MTTRDHDLHIILISIHGLIRGHDLELGRDPDTGGQIKYVVELAHALGQQPGVRRVDLLTRQIIDPNVSTDYAQTEESLGHNAFIKRLPAGPEGYIRKEELWDHLENFADHAMDYIRQLARPPDVIHSHYADAGYVGVHLCNLLGIPLIHTGHSLGRVKRRRLLATGLKHDQIEATYHITRRINAEEDTLAAARLVIASTSNEIEEQYGLYDYYQPEYMTVIPPGTDLESFHLADGSETQSAIYRSITEFLRQPEKPMILALSRPDERKNIATLIKAYGESTQLQQMANLVIIAGNRDDLRNMDNGPQNVLSEMLILIDAYDLYGKVAYPKHHQADDVPMIYRIAAATKGVFINPALTEPFGLTLIEAAASGLPIVATEDGGPRDIIGNCHNGLLIDPLDKEKIANALIEVLSDNDNWQTLAANGVQGVQTHYSWQAHSSNYLEKVQPLVQRQAQCLLAPRGELPSRSLYHDRAIIAELDRVLLAEPPALEKLINVIREHRKQSGFGIATGRGLESTLSLLKKHNIPMPDVLIIGMGTELYYAPPLTGDYAWNHHIDHQWQPKALRRILDDLPGLEMQPKSEQLRFKLSYYYDPTQAPDLDEIHRLLHKEEQNVNVNMSYGQYMDILPSRASKGFALRYFADQWGIPLEHILAVGATAGDEDMMRGNTLAVAVSNPHREELAQLVELDRVYFSEGAGAWGILEAIDYYDFFGHCRLPE
jgi:sucrose-phosphate synthase